MSTYMTNRNGIGADDQGLKVWKKFKMADNKLTRLLATSYLPLAIGASMSKLARAAP